MSSYSSINELYIDFKKREEINCQIGFNYDLVPLLELLEKINFCNQRYEIVEDNIIISYLLRINIFNFRDLFPLNVTAEIIGLPISISEKGYWGKEALVEKNIKKRKGLKIILNGDREFSHGGKTLSTFIFNNRFSTFGEYIESLRSPYRRRIRKALMHRKDLEIIKLDNKDFNEDHYNLYLSIMDRTKHPLETLSIEFFKAYESEIYEFVHRKTKNIVGFIQTKLIKDRLCFIFGGFRKEDNEIYDIYYNMLLKVIEIGIEKQAKTIEFGQTAEESKLKIGCIEVPKYVYVHHSNIIINWFIRLLIPLFSYKPYGIKHNVFK
ncbi:hypothetical protein [Tissierella sp.]|uniref:hypothetical protein n=1 Tax=Tissierella sp. TaxID=41274 RepID=UPI0028AA1C16|nr:hypothetical protein [Tissierella sp.]